MKEIIKKNSKLIGILLGLLQGVPGLDAESMQAFSSFPRDKMLFIILFGLFMPPILVLLNPIAKEIFSLVTKGRFSSGYLVVEKINSYVNIDMMIISGLLSLGISSMLSFHYAGIYDGRFTISTFFVAGGVGFLVAYLIGGRLGQRAENKA